MITIDNPSYRFPIVRLYSGFAVLLLADLVSSLFLWVSTTHIDELKSSIISFEIKNSTFDLACIGFFRGLLMIIILAKLENMTIAASQDGIKNEKPKKIISFFGFITFFGTFVYTAYKDIIVLIDHKNSNKGVKFYALCISCFVFGTLELLVYVKFLYHLKQLQRIYSCLRNEETTSNSPAKKNVNLPRLMKLTYPERWRLFFGMIGLCGSTGSQMIAPLFFGYVIQAASTGDMDALNKQILYLFLIYMIGSVASMFRSWLFTLAGQSIVATLRKQLFNHLIKQEIAFFDLNRTGELMNRLASDAEVIQNALSVNVSMLLRYALQIIGSIVVMLVTCPRLAGLLLAIIPIVGIAAQRYGAYVRNMQKKFQDDLANAATNAEETLSSMRTVRSFSQESKAEQDYSKGIDASFLAGKKLSIASGYFNMFVGVISQGTIVLVLWYGGKLVIDGDMNVGELTSFILYSLNVALAFAFLSSLYGDFMKAVGASIRIFELLDRVPEIKSGNIVVKNTKVNITFDDVAFSYPTRPETKVLKGLSFHMKPGETVALVGPSGGGKSTVMSLLERFYDPCSGTIYVGNHDLKSVNLDMLRKKMSIVSQEPVLFATTIANNIAYGVDASQDKIEVAAKQANAHDFIITFEEGYNTFVGERGIKLSGGQKQRVAIARALLMNPDILLLDEATSALDSESEHLVQEAIDRAMIGRTVLVIAHRLSTVRHASRVIVINKGAIAEVGTHDELIQANGVYKKLVLRQLEKGPLLEDGIDVDDPNFKI
ncbi:uncharacterized protein LOC101241118 isoform X2 [Hydra vulgaris]|uniref:Uncharacterized protein LOC101241118 isoform X2 n=1 Tax=Hydra vulgaris TaxID=6087 RepID=A0ABM4CPP8_HYDVU